MAQASLCRRCPVESGYRVGSVQSSCARHPALSAPLGFVLTVFGALIKGYVHISDPREVVLLGLGGSVMVPVIIVFSFCIARLWRWLWRNFPG